VDFSRLELRDILNNVDKVNLDPDVLAKLMAGADATGAAPVLIVTKPAQAVGATNVAQIPASGGVATDSPGFLPVAYSAADMERLGVT
jgi:hypothetical protein